MAHLQGIVDNTDTNATPKNEPGDSLVTWIMARVNTWRDARNGAFEDLWAEYYRMWRGRWVHTDATRKSERSRIVTPALSQALEMSVAELEEAVFGREGWIDLLDDQGDPDHDDIDSMRRQLLDDLDIDKVPQNITQAFLNGGLYGTLAAKIIVEPVTVPTVHQGTDKDGKKTNTPSTRTRVKVTVESIEPMDLIPDPDGTTIDDMLGITHEVRRPRSWLLEQPFGHKYAGRGKASTPTLEDTGRSQRGDREELQKVDPRTVLVTEYHGKVPRRLLLLAQTAERKENDEKENPLASAIISPGQPESKVDFEGEGGMVEVIVTIFDKSVLGRAIENPFLFKDRSIVACQYETVPGRFWGRGVMEKGYNPAKALDAEVRTRMDVMALISNPMMGADQTALPRGFDMSLRPGKLFMTTTNPKEVLFPIQFANLDPASFNAGADLERMVQMGTGAMDTATPLKENRRNETATGASLIAGTFVKRSKRALRNITKQFIEPIIQKVIHRRMQFDTERYPTDLEFRVVSTLGIVARELEQGQLTDTLALVQDSPQTRRTMIRAIFEESSSPFKAELKKALEADAQPTEQQQKLQQMQEQAAQIQLQTSAVEMQNKMQDGKNTQADTLLVMAKLQTELEQPGVDKAKLMIELGKLEKEFGELAEFRRQNDTAQLAVIGKILNDERGSNSDGSNSGS